MPSSILSSPERSKRRLSPLPPVFDKRARPAQSDRIEEQDIKESDDHDSQHLSSMTSTRTYRPYRPTTAISPSNSSSSDDTASNYRVRSKKQRIRSDAQVTEPPSRFSDPRWIPDNDPNTSLHQPSSISSSSSSHHYLPHQPMDSSEERRSPPPSLTLSTGQPLVNPPLKTQAAFVGKLFSMLEDEDIGKTGLIHWSNSGTTFTCPNPTEFAKTVLPRFFKHNNWQSFVRQLNMYSFNKVNDLYATSSDPMAWEFRHPLFRQGEPHLLASIKRKTNRPINPDGPQQTSPSDENSERPMAGWMRDDVYKDGSPPTPIPSLPSTANRVRPEVFGYNMKTGETIQSRPYEQTARASSRAYATELTRPRLQHTASASQIHNTHRVPDRVHRNGDDKDRKPLLYPDPLMESSRNSTPASSLGSLTSQIAYLEDKVARLSETLSLERVDRIRTHMDLLEYVRSVTVWLPDAPPREVDALRVALDQQQSDLRARHAALLSKTPGEGDILRAESARGTRYVSPHYRPSTFNGDDFASSRPRAQPSTNHFPFTDLPVLGTIPTQSPTSFSNRTSYSALISPRLAMPASMPNGPQSSTAPASYALLPQLPGQSGGATAIVSATRSTSISASSPLLPSPMARLMPSGHHDARSIGAIGGGNASLLSPIAGLGLVEYPEVKQEPGLRMLAEEGVSENAVKETTRPAGIKSLLN